MRVTVVATGGTIASRSGPGGAVASVRGADLVDSAGHLLPAEVEIDVRDVLTTGSFALTLEDMRRIVREAQAALASGAEGVVVTHGTDSMEESAFLADLLHAGDAPIVFTGAQRPFDAPDADGPQNLVRAVRHAADSSLRGRGVLIAFAGRLVSARGARKAHTWHLDAFDGTPATAVVPRSVLAGASSSSPLPEVAVVAGFPGSDGTSLRDAVRHRPEGLVFQGTGAGNASPGDAAAVEDAVGMGIPVVVTTRVSHGPVRPIYGNGGGRTLQDAGAILAGDLSTAQARVLLSVCLSCGPGAGPRAAEWIATHCEI